MMARVVIRKPEIPCFVLNSQVRVADWEQVCGTHQGLQVLSFLITRKVLSQRERVPVSIVAGNRNIAIFLVALPASAAEPLLVFLGCYQVPMYLTPLLMQRLYRLKCCSR